MFCDKKIGANREDIQINLEEYDEAHPQSSLMKKEHISNHHLRKPFSGTGEESTKNACGNHTVEALGGPTPDHSREKSKSCQDEDRTSADIQCEGYPDKVLQQVRTMKLA